MKTFLGRTAAGIGVVSLAALAGYWHFGGFVPQGDPERPQASVPAQEPAREPATTSEQLAAREPAVEAAPEIASATTPSPEALLTPSFELLRVEPDGSTVIAGRAEPGSRIELRSGDAVLASETAGTGGDFAMALAAPLTVGEHELRLESRDGAGNAQRSAQSAIVNVPPRGREADLLVALGAPNTPTRFIESPALAELAPAPVAETNSSAQPGEAPTSAPESSGGSAVDAPQAARLAIAAVEIERDRIYVAGSASPGSSLRLYVDDAFIGETVGTANEDFLAEARADISVGAHVLRADEVARDGTVTSRVEVPFERPEGPTMAALAPSLTGAAAAGGSDGAASVPPTPQAGEPASASASLAEPSPTEEIADGPAGPASAPAPSGSPQMTATAVEPSQRTPAGAPAGVAPSNAASAPAGSVVSAAPETTPASATQAALQPVEGRVIIRRGDTLWRISRETYGAGRRYTTIYLANGDQIRDPDLIYPGQIFRLPDGESEGASLVR